MSMSAETYPDDLRYHSEHDWARVEGEEAVCGITWFAQQSLGEVVYVELPAAGTQVTGGEPFGEIESLKTVSDVYAPVSGIVVATNALLDDEPARVNADCYGDGWLIRVRMTDPAEADALLSAADYRALLVT